MNSSKIVYIKDEKYFLFDGKTLTPTEAKSAKKYFTALCVDPSALYLYSQKLPSTLSDEQVSIKMDIGMYEEGGADEEKEYTTCFIRNQLAAEDNDIVDMFGITDDQAASLYGDIAKETNAIDLISPSVMAYHSVYDNEDLGYTDIFLYFGHEEAYGAIYSNGKYITHRNLENLARISALCGWELDTLKATLKNRGLNEIAYDENEIPALSIAKASIVRSIKKIIHTLNHKKGLFSIKDPNRVFIDFEGDGILGLELIFSNFDVDLDNIKPIKIKSNTDPLLHHDLVIANYLLGVANKKFEDINLSPFKREKPIYKKPAGHLFLAIACSMLLVFCAYYILSLIINSKNEELAGIQAQIDKTKKSSMQIVEKVKALRKTKDELNKEYISLEDKSKSLNKSKQAVPFIYSTIDQRQKMVDDALMGLSKNQLGAQRLEQNGSERMKIHIVADLSKQEKIANFMDFMYERGYQNTFTDKIDGNNTFFKSIVEIVR